MKFLPAQFFYFLRQRPGQLRLLSLARFLLLLAALVTLFSVAFHFIMAREGQSHSWVTGFYWVLTVMTTLGFGDITFHSDLGRIFSSVVLLSGVMFLLILLPFTFMEFFYEPWMRIQAESRAPTELPVRTEGHVILTSLDPVTNNLIQKLNRYHYEYVLLVSQVEEALRLHDLGYQVMRGDLDSPQTYLRAHADRARLVATTANDMLNTNIASTVREVSETVPIIAIANSRASVDVLELAGSNHVLQLGQMLGQALARRVSGGESTAHVVGEFDELLIAEAPVDETTLIGKTVAQSRLRQEAGVTVLGLWKRGEFKPARPDTELTAGTVLVDLGIPPGFSPVIDDLDAVVEAELIDRYELTGRQIILYLTDVPSGEVYTFNYGLLARFPIKAQTPSSTAYDYYTPDQRDTQAPQRIVVELGTPGN